MRLSAGEAGELTAAAERAALTVTAYTAAAALAAARGMPAPRAVVSRQQLLVRSQLVEAMTARTELARVGTNLNQLAKVANTTGSVPSELAVLLGRVEAAVVAVTDVVAELAGRGEL